MTTAKFTTAKYAPSLNVVRVNGRDTFVNRITSLTQTRPGHFEGLAYGDRFHIEGGRAAGGSQRDWFVSWENAWEGYLTATSLVGAIKLIENC